MEMKATRIVVTAAALAALPAAAAAKRPNIVLVISDDTRMLDFGCYGSPDAVTPNIDRLAAEGLRFTRFFQATAMSSPTRHCLLTGLYPVRSGAYPNHTYIDDGIATLPRYLKECGYRVAMQGKRHIAPMSAFPFEELAKPNADVNPARIEPFLREVAESGEPFFLYVASHDAGLQTAFIVRWKGVTQPGTTTDALCEYVDVTPTLVEIASGAVPKGLDGKSFRKVIEGRKSRHKQYVFGIQTSRGILNGPDHYGIRSVRDERYLYIRNLTPEATFQCVITKQEYFKEWQRRGASGDAFARERAGLYQKRPAEELYDIVKDPCQMHDLAADPACAKVMARMRPKLDAWMKSQGDLGAQTELDATQHLLSNRKKTQNTKR